MTPLLAVTGVSKRYPGVLALDAVDFELQAGEIHCIVGENGAGKSTLVKILAGAIAFEAGSIAIDGTPAAIRRPADARACGIGVIHQDFKLVPELSAAENIFLGREPTTRPFGMVDFAAMRRETHAILRELGTLIDPAIPVRTLSVAHQQIVEIAKALSANVRVLILDEPSASLTDRELKNLFDVLHRLKSRGVGIVYISHRLDEIFDIGDRVTVLRDGRSIQTATINDVDRRTLIQWMVGRELASEFPKVSLDRGREILRLERVSGGMVSDVSLSVYEREVLGIAGLVGAGRSELARIIFGADPLERGTMYLHGVSYTPRHPREAIDAGIGLLTEDRNRYGLVTQRSVRENISLANLRALARGLFLDEQRERAVARQFVDELRIKTPSIEQPVEYLSGGTRQKVVLARWLYTKSRVLIFDEPTAGIDIGVKYEIYNLIDSLAASGLAVVVISSDLPELLGICDWIAVMCGGRLTGILNRADAMQESILALAMDEAVHAN
jgi:ribose transport system ATP-binding protein